MEILCQPQKDKAYIIKKKFKKCVHLYHVKSIFLLIPMLLEFDTANLNYDFATTARQAYQAVCLP